MRFFGTCGMFLGMLLRAEPKTASPSRKTNAGNEHNPHTYEAVADLFVSEAFHACVCLYLNVYEKESSSLSFPFTSNT